MKSELQKAIALEMRRRMAVGRDHREALQIEQARQEGRVLQFRRPGGDSVELTSRELAAVVAGGRAS